MNEPTFRLLHRPFLSVAPLVPLQFLVTRLPDVIRHQSLNDVFVRGESSWRLGEESDELILR